MLEAYGVITAVSPAGEWSYEQPLPDGSTQRLPPRGCAGGDAQLVEMVRQFRARLNISLDNLELDIAAHIKRNSPQNDKYPGRTQPLIAPERVVRKIRPLIERLRSWLGVMAAKQPKLLIEDDAKARAEVCATCPQNIQWRAGCAPCNDEVIQRGRHLRQRVDYPRADALKGCRLHDFYLPSAVFIDRDDLGVAHPDAPALCWMNHEPSSIQAEGN